MERSRNISESEHDEEPFLEMELDIQFDIDELPKVVDRPKDVQHNNENDKLDPFLFEIETSKITTSDDNNHDIKYLKTRVTAISECILVKSMNVPLEITQTIGEYANGHFIYCSKDNCIQKELSISHSEWISIQMGYYGMYGMKQKRFICTKCTSNYPYCSDCCNEPASECPGMCRGTLCSSFKCLSQAKKCKICNQMYCNQYFDDEYGNCRGLCGAIETYECVFCGNTIKDECEDCNGYCYDYCKIRHCHQCSQKSTVMECKTCTNSRTFHHAKCQMSTLDVIWYGDPSCGDAVFVKCGCFQCKKYICLQCECEILVKDQQSILIDDTYYCLQHKNWINE
eukprot:118428_1